MAESSAFGIVDGVECSTYTLKHDAGGIEVTLCELGATVTSVRVPDASGTLGEVTLGFDEVAPYRDGTSPYFGCVAGRCANRIAKGKFVLDNCPHQLATNNGPNHLHGGERGFDKRMWNLVSRSCSMVRFEYVSPDGEESYPGQLSAYVTYSLPTPSQLRIEYFAITDRATPCNLTNHTYWNLADGGATPIVEHEIEMRSDFYTPVDDTSIPTGEVRSVSGAMDLRSRVAIGAGLKDADNGMGYDHNYALSGPSAADGLRPVARVWEPRGGRWMSVRTDQPGVQFYTGNYLDGLAGRGGTKYGKHHGFCLETQTFPDSVNRPHFPSNTLRPGDKYKHVTIHEFGCAPDAPPTGEW